MDWITTSGRTLDEAKSHALDQLGIVADEAEFDVVNDVEKGMFGRVKTEAKIRARVRPKPPAVNEDRGRRRGSGGNRNRKSREQGGRSNERNSPKGRSGGKAKEGQSDSGSGRSESNSSASTSSSSGNTAKPASTPRSDSKTPSNNPKNKNRPKNDKAKRDTVDHEISREDQERVAQEFLEGVLSSFDMTGAVAVASELADDNAIELDVTGEELGLLVGQKGVTLNALQELTRTVVQRKADGAKTERLRVDVAGYRARRTVALQGFATKIASDVVESGNEKLLEPMGPADRKVVHDTVNAIDGVETGSEGEEPRRRVVIRPA